MNILSKRCQSVFASMLFFIGFLFVGHARALCLNDRHPSLEIESESSKFVVVGIVEKAIDYTSPDDPTGIAGTKYVVSVTEVFKGSPPKKLVIDSENTSSRLPLTVGTQYLLFVQGIATDGLVDSCGNSGGLEERKNAITELRNTHFKKPVQTKPE